MDINLKTIFNKYVGKEIPMVEEKSTLKLENIAPIEVDTVKLANKNHPLILKMKKEAAKHGLTIRFNWPGIRTTCEYNAKRVNAHIKKETDGKYRIENKFNLG